MLSLFIKSGIKIAPLFYGGSHEKKRRPGTENIAGIVGLAKTLEIAEKKRETDFKKISELKEGKDVLNQMEVEGVVIQMEGISGEAYSNEFYSSKCPKCAVEKPRVKVCPECGTEEESDDEFTYMSML